MSTEETANPAEPVLWAGIGESLIPDMRHREFLCFGTRSGDVYTTSRVFSLEGWKKESLFEMLTAGKTPPIQLKELDDTTGIKLHKTFDLPKGAGVATVIQGFQQAARGFGSVLERVASGRVGFHLPPRLFDRIWRDLSGGSAVRFHGYHEVDGERAMVASGESWRKGAHAAVAAASEQKTGPRPQLFGHRVLDAELGVCPECGSSMVRDDAGKKVCELDHLKSKVIPPDIDVGSLPGVEEAIQAELAGLTDLDESLLDFPEQEEA